jgi:hypothetical protein
VLIWICLVLFLTVILNCCYVIKLKNYLKIYSR